MEKEWERETKRERFHNSAIKITKLYNLRKRINITPEPIGPATPIFRDVLQESRQMVKDWGGKMYFIYLPAFNLYTIGNEHLNHDFVMQTVTTGYSHH